jgi:uncharacterized HhH-GPD family protein
MAKTLADVPSGYEQFEIVDHRREIDAPYSPSCLALKIREDDLPAWALHALLRSQLPRFASAHSAEQRPRPKTLTLHPAPTPNSQAVAKALLHHADALAAQLVNSSAQFTSELEANRLIQEDPFAFLLAVIADMGIKAERAWALPYELRKRIGQLTPTYVRANADAVRLAFQERPKLHRFIHLVPNWFIDAALIVLDTYDGDTARLWSDEPTATELRRRLEVFPGIGQKKAAMAVEILARDLHIPIRHLSGSDVAYDVHLRRVFLRTGLADHDDVHEMVAAARAVYPERPGALDLPAWDVGRRWCRPTQPDCPTCPLNIACPRLVVRGSRVRGT